MTLTAEGLASGAGPDEASAGRLDSCQYAQLPDMTIVIEFEARCLHTSWEHLQSLSKGILSILTASGAGPAISMTKWHGAENLEVDQADDVNKSTSRHHDV